MPLQTGKTGGKVTSMSGAARDLSLLMSEVTEISGETSHTNGQIYKPKSSSEELRAGNINLGIVQVSVVLKDICVDNFIWGENISERRRALRGGPRSCGLTDHTATEEPGERTRSGCRSDRTPGEQGVMDATEENVQGRTHRWH